ncbi:hypothetical protein FA95DRAFT_124160 [Auriscalpium vulgare]|uniref:Uncharacterized protein n=1 Tax=Auriscalpium vulgare TaxID=40419 RepID=A0ACB8RNA0_9AGAM|nr:hypothetical protein FA95DRAFT_124160 [Auriscalpium vulgare]
MSARRPTGIQSTSIPSSSASASRAGFSRPLIPNELLVLIYTMVESELSADDLLCLRLVNHAFCALATLRAFRSVVAVNTPKSASGLLRLLMSPLARYIEEVTIRDTLVDCNGDLLTQSVPDKQSRWRRLKRSSFIPPHDFLVRVYLVAAVSQLHKLPALRAVRLTRNSPPPHHLSLLTEQSILKIRKRATLHYVLLEVLSVHRPPRLVSLTINNLVPLEDRRLTVFVRWRVSDHFKELLAGVEELHLGIHDGAYDTNAWQHHHFWWQLAGVLMNMQALTVFEIRLPEQLASDIPGRRLPSFMDQLLLLREVLWERIWFSSEADEVQFRQEHPALVKLQIARAP